jgi:hypothetical protein
MEIKDQKAERLADDLLYGASAIADFLGVTEMQVYHWVRKDRIPVGKMGKTLIASRRQLRKAIGNLTA